MEKALYKKIKSYREFYLDVSDIHQLYIRLYGNPEGIPVFYLHGGPGGYTGKECARFFNSRKYNVIVFDQRGCGKSLPRNELLHNTSFNLVNDIEKIRCFLKFKKIMLFGGSWGASLAILYSIKYPKNVMHYIIRGFTLLEDDIYPESFKQMFPAEWGKIVNLAKQKTLRTF